MPQLLIIGALLCCAGWLSAVELEGETFPDQIAIGEARLPVYGSHHFTWGWWDIQLCVFYAAPGRDAATLLAGDHPMQLTIHYLRDFDEDDMHEALREGVAQTSGRSVDDLGPLAEPLRRFNAGVPAVSDGDRLHWRYLSSGVIELRQGDAVLARSDDRDLALAIFAIWIGADALDEDLRAGLLDGS